MAAPTIISISELTHRLAAIEKEVDLVSFDIFDTLLERCIEPPDAVKLASARRLAARLGKNGAAALTAAAIHAARDEVEASLRRQAVESGFDHECAFSDIAAGVARHLAPDNEEAMSAAFIECEMEAEKEALFPKSGAIAVVAAARAQGKRIVAISDMYLDGTLIRQLLRHFQLDGLIDFIYVSADVKLAKYSGRLFRHVLEAEGVAPARMVHVGDHAHSDFAAPRRLGIRSYHLRDTVNLQRRQEGHTLHWLAARNPFWRGRQLLHMIPSPASEDFHYRYGYSQLGPVFCGFVLGVMEELRRREIGKVFFLAREGELFRLLYRKMAPALEHSSTAESYLYVSRKAVFLPASWRGLSRRLLNTVLYNPKQKGFFSLANALGIAPEEFEGVARRFGLERVDQPIREWADADFARLLADEELQSIVARHACAARTVLRRYLAQEGFFAEKRVALVDIGWNGTIQKAISEAFGDDPDFPEIAGLYVSFNDGFKYGFSPGEAQGILYDSSTSPLSHNVFAPFEEMFENSARALHGTTTGYREDASSGRVEPVLREEGTPDRDAEKSFEARTAALRQGVLDFADGFIKALRLTGHQFSDIKPAVLDMAERGVVHPSLEEVTHFLEMIHTEDMGSDNVMRFSEYRLSGPSALFRPRRFLRLLGASNWKYGTARTVGVPGFNHLLRTVELSVIRRRNPERALVPRHGPQLMESMLYLLVRCGTFPVLSRVRKILLRK
jgi:predicted HAD superfamily hydrolase